MSRNGSTGRQRRGLKRWRTVTTALLASLLAAFVTLYAKSEHIVLGAEAYIYGYPLVMMDVTRAHTAITVGPENELRRVRQFPDARFRDVVRPNVDTLYTTTFIDMAQGPWVFEMAPNDQRYEVMPFMDGWTNVFAAPGTRLNGTAGGRFLLAGPTWQGTVPEGLSLLRSPTRMVWLIGRTQANGIADFALVHRLQDGVTLRRVDEWLSARPAAPTSSERAASSGADRAPPPVSATAMSPIQQMQAMRTETFFVRLAALMVDNPPPPADGPMMVKLSRLDIVPGRPPQWGALDRWAVGLGRWIADFTVARELKKPRDLRNGWSTPPEILGNYGTYYNTRAVVAMVGLGANLPADAMYPNTKVDASGAALHGNHRYRLHLKAGELPPVRAFWSITAYGIDDFLIENPLQRFAIGDRDPLVFNADGSLDLWVQADEPTGGPKNNWLPVKRGEPFLLNARLYWPKREALSGAWGMPGVERVD